MPDSFRNRVARFWRAFEKNEPHIRELIDNSKKSEKKAATTCIQQILDLVFHDVIFQLGVNIHSKYELILSPEGDRIKLLLFNYWLRRAPEHLFRKWNFYASMPVYENTSYQIDLFGITLEEKDLTIYIETDYQNFKFNLDIYSPKLLSIDDSERYALTFIFLDQYISEVYTIELIGSINFVTERLDKKETEIHNLRKEIDFHIKKHKWTRSKDPLKAYIGYKRKPLPGEENILRREIHLGYTSNGQIIHAYLSNDSKFINKYNLDCVEFGFFYYANVNTEEENLLAIRHLIATEINQECEKLGVADCTGAALGFNYSYIDFIIYDYKLFNNIIQEIILRFDLKNSGFSFFNSDRPTIIF